MTVFLTNFSPTGNFVNPGFTVSFDITSDGNPIDTSTLDVLFGGNFSGVDDTDFADAIQNGAFQDAYDGTITATTVSGNPGFSVTITPSRLYLNNTLEIQTSVDTTPSSGATTFNSAQFSTATVLGVIATADPIIGSSATAGGDPVVGLTFSGKNNNVLFQLNDLGEPIVTNRVPVPNSSGALRTTNIQFSLHDAGEAGVNSTTIDAFIDGTQAISNGAFVAPFVGSITAATIDGFAGFSVVINPVTNFLFATLVTIRVVADDLIADPSAVNTLDTTYTFTTEAFVDVAAPDVTPTQPATGLLPDSCIEFDWLDAPQGLGVDFNTLDVTLRRELTVDCITSIRDDIAVVNGVAASGYTLFASAIVVGLQIGFHITLCPAVPFNELEIITVIVTGDDITGNTGASTFAVSTAELTPPTILNLNPAPNETGVDAQSSIVFEMHDSSGTGVNTSLLSVNVDDGEAVINGVAQTGFSLVITPKTVVDEFSLQFDGYSFAVTRDAPFTPGREIAVDVDGYDAYGNRATLVYDFTVAADTTPPVITFVPVDGTTGNNRDQIVTVDVVDVIGVDTATVDITVNGNQAVLAGAAVAPFDVTISDIVTTPGVIDGYRYVIDTELNFVFNETVPTVATASDIFANSASATASFTTFDDVTSPTITGITPRDEQLEVSLRPEITFTVRDAYDIAFDLTSVDIGNEQAIRNGLIQSGFSMNQARISGGTEGVDPGDGYSIIITPDVDLSYGQVVEVSISVRDRSRGNITTESVTWTVTDPAPPLFDIVPLDVATSVPVDSNIEFEVFDDGYRVDIDTLNVWVDDVPAIVNNVVQSPLFVGTVDTIVDGYHYRGEINPRFLLLGESAHTVRMTAEEPVSNNVGSDSVTFTTGLAPLNPETIYVGDSNGVQSLLVSSADFNSVPTELLDGYFVWDLQARPLQQINRLVVGTRDSGAFVMPTNFAETTLFYSVGDEITKVYLSEKNDGTLYLANRTRSRVDVYYSILLDDVGRDTPDVFYDADGYALPGIPDGYFTDMVVTEGTSTVKSGSASIFLGTPAGAVRIETDESTPGSTEINGQLVTYGILGTDRDFEILSGTTNEIISIDVNTRLNRLYIATRSGEGDTNAVTFVDLSDNSFDGSIPEERLMNRFVEDLNFQDN